MNNLGSLLGVWCSQLWEFLPFLSCYILGALFISLLITLCLLLTGSLLKSDHFPPWPQLTPRAVTCTAVLPQVRHTFTLFMVFTELLPTQRGGKSHLDSLKAIWNRAKTNPLMLKPSVQHLQLFLSNGKFLFTELQQQTFWPSSSFFYFKYNLHLLSALVSLHMCLPVLETRSIYAMLLLLTISTLQIWRRQPGFYQWSFINVQEINQILKKPKTVFYQIFLYSFNWTDGVEKCVDHFNYNGT